MAFATAKFWGILPHVIWRFPFRYYKELRDHYIAQLTGSVVEQGSSSTSVNWDEESFGGDSV
jgi:hypothetical protein